MPLPTADQICRASQAIYEAMPATPQYAWPLLSERAGAEVWVKHENHTPLGAFKIRSALNYFHRLRESGAPPRCAVPPPPPNYDPPPPFPPPPQATHPT